MEETEPLEKGDGLVQVFGEELMNIVACFSSPWHILLYSHRHVVAQQK